MNGSTRGCIRPRLSRLVQERSHGIFVPAVPAPGSAGGDPHAHLPGHVKGPIVLLDYDQDELGVAYNQEFYSRTPMR